MAHRPPDLAPGGRFEAEHDRDRQIGGPPRVTTAGRSSTSQPADFTVAMDTDDEFVAAERGDAVLVVFGAVAIDTDDELVEADFTADEIFGLETGDPVVSPEVVN